MIRSYGMKLHSKLQKLIYTRSRVLASERPAGRSKEGRLAGLGYLRKDKCTYLDGL